MTEVDFSTQQKWDRKHSEATDLGEVAQVLRENAHLLPTAGEVLDLACGRGANALELSRLGLNVTAWDISSVAIEILNRAAKNEDLEVEATVRDVKGSPPPIDRFDVVLVSHFLDRDLCADIEASIRPGGLLLYQTFNLTSRDGPRTSAFKLSDNELLSLFPNLKLRVYREETDLGDTHRGTRGVTLLVAQK